MWEMIQGDARAKLTARERLDAETLARLRAAGALVTDDRRRRPLYFDGRFLAARDLTREQQYFLTRQSDLGRAVGAGVVHGLVVSTVGDGSQLRVDPGHGVTEAGESIVVPRAITVPLASVATTQRLDVSFGLAKQPTDPARNRTGVFVVALRPVEFTANPIAAYPTSISDPRAVEDGDIVDAVAVSLVPYPDDGARDDLGMRRARIARQVFVERAARGLPVEALPVAMVLLDRGVVRWLDPFMVRRELGSSNGDVLGFGVGARALREAHTVQYDAHLADVLRDRARANRGAKFAATDHFAALPAAGRMPAAAINTADFTQSFFPPEVDVDLSIVPEDEIPALLEESLLLPAIDLTLPSETMESVAVSVLLPVPRQHLRTVRRALSIAAAPALVRTLRTAAPGLVARRLPLEVLRGLRMPRLADPGLPPGNPAHEAWTQAVTAAAQSTGGTLWYVRRRNLQTRSDVVGQGVRVLPADELATQLALEQTIAERALLPAYTALRGAASAVAGAEAVEFLSSPKIRDSRFLMAVALRELQLAGRPLGSTSESRLWAADVAAVAQRFAATGLGDGIGQLEDAIETETSGNSALYDAIAAAVAGAHCIAALDRIGDRRRGDEDALAEFAHALALAAPGGPAAVQALVTTTLEET